MGSKREIEEEKEYQKQETVRRLDLKNKENEELKRKVDTLEDQVRFKAERMQEVTKDNGEYQQEIKDLKMAILKSERPLAKYQQLRKLYKGFISSIKPHLDL